MITKPVTAQAVELVESDTGKFEVAVGATVIAGPPTALGVVYE